MFLLFKLEQSQATRKATTTAASNPKLEAYEKNRRNRLTPTPTIGHGFYFKYKTRFIQ